MYAGLKNISLSILLVLTPIVESSEPADHVDFQTASENCSEQVRHCEDLLKFATELVQGQDDQLHSQLDTMLRLDLENSDLVKQNEKLIQQAEAWYKNPWVVAPLGFALGVVVIELAK